MPHAAVRSDQRYAWHGQSLLITNVHGECDATLPISGFYFREARFLRTLGFRINDSAPWLCEDAVISPRELLFAYAFPEVASYGGGGTGQSQDETPVDDHGLPQRAIDIRLRYRVALSMLEVDAVVTNRSVRKALKFDLSWILETDFADIQETLGERRQQDAEVRVIPDDRWLTFEYAHARLPYRTVIEARGADWRASTGGFSSAVELRSGESVALVAPRSNFAICERDWPSTVVKLPTATSSVFCGLLEICSTSVMEPASSGRCSPASWLVK